jgi:hypothetical protein
MQLLTTGAPASHTNPLLGSGGCQASAVASSAGYSPAHHTPFAARQAQAVADGRASSRRYKSDMQHYRAFAGAQHYRAYASRAAQALSKGHAAGPASGQQVTMRIAVASPNQLAEPYT